MKVRLRTQQVTIDTPTTKSEPWVRLYVQRCEDDDDGNEINVVDRWGAINKPLSKIALDVFFYFEVVPNLQPGQISGYSIADSIKNTCNQWIIEKFGGTIDSQGRVYL